MENEAELLKARVVDVVTICLAKDIPKFIGFLSTGEATLLDKVVKALYHKYRFSSGHENGERTVLGVFPNWCDDSDEQYPIVPICFHYRECDKLSHRDFLGALMALGITRRSVGDILIGDGFAVVYVLSDIAKFVLSEITKIGNVGVKPSVLDSAETPAFQVKTVPISSTVSSARLDCVIASLINSNRGKAEELITDGLVAINSFLVTKTTKKVLQNDVISIRGFGKFVIQDMSGQTKKGRIILNAVKYI